MQVYIHIPFCDLKCKYCRFASIGISQKLKIDFYVQNLISEIKKSPFKKGILNTIYFGGGTPSVLSKNNLENILEILKEKFDFDKNIEISIESTPNNITKQNLETWEKLGINRISIGIQTLNKKSLKEINRGNKSDIELCFSNLEKYNKINNISLDFIIGLPYVKPGEILKNIKSILDRYDFIKHISVYMLEEYYNPDKIIETKFDNITYPKDWDKLGISQEDYLSEYLEIKNYLLKNGFVNYEISNFGKFGYECKHNIGYWEHKEVLAFGMGAGGFTNKKRYLNADNFKDYYAGKKIFEEKLTYEEIFLEKVMFGLRTNGLKKEIYEKLDGEKLDYFIKNGYLQYQLSTEGFNFLKLNKKNQLVKTSCGQKTLKLTDRGVLILDYILGEIIK